MYIDLFGSSDRLGGNIADMVAQILYAMNNKMYIRYHNRDVIRAYNYYNQNYNRTIFIQTLFDIIDKYNSTIENTDFTQLVDLAAPTHFEIFSRTLLDLKLDMFSAFKKIYTSEIKNSFMNRGIGRGYTIPFDPKRTILIHLRLEDVRNRPDYNGMMCANHFKNHIESGNIANNITNDEIQKINPNCNMQSPISFSRIQSVIDKIKLTKPDYEVIVVTNPGENLTHIPYKCISNVDEAYDLFLLCNCETLILSKSNYALSSLFFGIAKDVYVPLWGHLPCYGLYTKYDQTNFKYFV